MGMGFKEISDPGPIIDGAAKRLVGVVDIRKGQIGSLRGLIDF